jgi:DNA-binding IclR family transcriptional regulator
MSTNSSGQGWTFLTNHTQVLLGIARDPNVRLRDLAEHIGITERAVQRIVADLTEAGFLERTRVGRRNHYVIRRKRPMRHPAQLGHDIGALLDLLELEKRVGARNSPDSP